MGSRNSIFIAGCLIGMLSQATPELPTHMGIIRTGVETNAVIVETVVGSFPIPPLNKDGKDLVDWQTSVQTNDGYVYFHHRAKAGSFLKLPVRYVDRKLDHTLIQFSIINTNTLITKTVTSLRVRDSARNFKCTFTNGLFIVADTRLRDTGFDELLRISDLQIAGDWVFKNINITEEYAK